MTCRWQELLSILPPWLRESVDKVGRESLQELRLRIGAPPELVLAGQSRWLDRPIALEDIHFCINTASRYSPWTAESQCIGFLTAPGGHRIGLISTRPSPANFSSSLAIADAISGYSI